MKYIGRNVSSVSSTGNKFQHKEEFKILMDEAMILNSLKSQTNDFNCCGPNPIQSFHETDTDKGEVRDPKDIWNSLSNSCMCITDTHFFKCSEGE